MLAQYYKQAIVCEDIPVVTLKLPSESHENNANSSQLLASKNHLNTALLFIFLKSNLLFMCCRSDFISSAHISGRQAADGSYGDGSYAFIVVLL